MADDGQAEPTEFTFSSDELYRLGLTYYKENEGKTLQLPYQLKIDLVALTQQAKLGSLKESNLPPLGTFDIIGKERRAAWSLLGELSKEEAKAQFTSALLKAAPQLNEFIAEKREERIKELKAEEEEEERNREEEEKRKAREEERQQEELQRRAIQDALNKQTFGQFKCYAEQQCPGNPDQQALLIKQLQEQHYYQYMQRLYQQQESGSPLDIISTPKSDIGIEMNGVSKEDSEPDREGDEEETSLVDEKPLENGIIDLNLEDKTPDMISEYEEPEEANMWTRKEINEFKETIRRDEGEAVLKIGHGETVTVRVPTHLDGKSLYWEFATDSYDIGFGLFFEWVDPEDTQVTVHISDSEDESEEYITDEDKEDGEEGDPEHGGRSGLIADTGPPTSCIIPTYRRDCHEEVYAGSHTYPRQGVYQLKFDNSYSLWRSKTLYYRVYYTR